MGKTNADCYLGVARLKELETKYNKRSTLCPRYYVLRFYCAPVKKNEESPKKIALYMRKQPLTNSSLYTTKDWSSTIQVERYEIEEVNKTQVVINLHFGSTKRTILFS